MSKISSKSTTEEAPSTSIVTTRKSIENLQKIDLIGNVSHQITGAKLPSNRQVLQVLFYNMRFVNLSAKQSAKLAIDAVQIFWHQARIPIREGHKCIEKLLKLYEKWKNFQKTISGKRSNAQKQAVETFVEHLDELFDIAAADALVQIVIVEDRQFLEMQRQKGRPGCMAGVDMALWDRERKAQERKDKKAARKRKYEEEKSSQAGMFCILIHFRFDRPVFYRRFSTYGVV